MSTFLDAVFVRFSNRGKKSTQERVVAELCAFAKKLGLTMAPDGDWFDSESYIDLAEPWVSIHSPPGSEGAAAESIARTLGGDVIAISQDDETLAVRAWHDGVAIDYYVHPASGSAPRKNAGRPRRWSTLLATNHDPKALAKVFRMKSSLDDKRIAIASMVAIPSSLLDPSSTPSARMRFRSPRRTRRSALIEGPPAFGPSCFGGSGWHLLGRGVPIAETWSSVGGDGRGLSIELSGPAVDSGIVVIDSVELRGERKSATQATTTAGKRAFVTTFPEQWIAAATRVEIDPAAHGPFAAAAALEGVDMQVYVTAKRARAGRAELVIRFVPMQAPQAELRVVRVVGEP